MHQQHEKEIADLKSQLAAMKTSYEGSRHEISQRDQKLQQCLSDLKILEERCLAADSTQTQNQRLSEELERLNSALRDIAHAVVQDADTVTIDNNNSPHLHLSQGSTATASHPSRSPKRIRSSQAFAEGTISAVQASLHKYQLAIHDLQVKLQSNTEQFHATKKQLDHTEHNRETLEMRLNELTECLDSTTFQLTEVTKERDSLQKTLDDIRSDKHSVERGNAELNSIVGYHSSSHIDVYFILNLNELLLNLQVDSLNSDYEKLQNVNTKLQRSIDSLEDEKKSILNDLKRIQNDKDIQEMNLR